MRIRAGGSRLSQLSLLVFGLVALFAACSSAPRQAEVAEPLETPEAPPPAEREESEIVLLFPSPNDDLLHAERRTVVPIDSPEDRAKQVLEELFRGPRPGLLAAVPVGVEVREVFILPNGTVYADISPDLLKTSGSARELMAVYSIVDTLALNLAGASRVGILVDGAVHETLSGHVYTGKPLAPDYRYVEESARPQRAEAVRDAGASGDSDSSEKDGQDEDEDEDSSEEEEEIEIPSPPPSDLV